MNKLFFVSFIFVFFTACIQKEQPKQDRCKHIPMKNGFMVSCSQDTIDEVITYTVDKPQDGKPGVDGSSCSVIQEQDSAKIECTDGSSATIYNGTQGNTGETGKSCQLTDLENGVLIKCGDEEAIVWDGSEGNPGLDGVSPQFSSDQIKEKVDPCGPQVGHFNEILLHTYGGEWIAHLTDKGKEYLTTLLPNIRYQTSDDQACLFYIDSNGDIQY